MQLIDEVTRSGRFPCARGRVTPNKYCWNEPGASVEAIQMPTDSAEVDHLIFCMEVTSAGFVVRVSDSDPAL